MKKTLGFAVAGLGLLIVLLGMLIAIFDIRTPPEPDPTQWHAYLTAEEVDHPLAEYWYKRAAADPIVLAALNKGPMPEGQVLQWEDRGDLLKPGYLAGENGWRRNADGSAYVAVKTFFPGATVAMIDWWFVWAQQDEHIRYKIWYPGSHYAMSEGPTPGAPEYDNPKPYWGLSRYPVEDVGLGVTQLRLDFVAPYEFGFEELPDDATMLAVRVGTANGAIKTTDMVHYVRPVEGGVEMRSRFWIADDLEGMSGGAGILAFLVNNPAFKRNAIPQNLPYELALHCANEYSQLASFLPEVYERFGPAAQSPSETPIAIATEPN